MAPPKSSSTLFSSLPYELYHHILSFAVDRELLDPSSRNQHIRIIASFQSLNRRICEMKEMQTYFNEFWWKVYERNFGLNPVEQKELKMKDEMIKKGELKRKILLANYIKFKVKQHSKFDPNGCKEELKTVVVGAIGVGKSALTIYFVQNIFVEEYDPTIEDSYRKTFMVDNIPALMDVLDTAEPENYSVMRDQYLRCGNAYVMVCSVTDRSSIVELQYLVERLIRIKDKEVNDMPVVFAINKTDLLTTDFNTREQTLKEYIEGINDIINNTSLVNCSIVETSAKMGENVTLVFEEVVRRYRMGTIDNLELLQKVIDLDSSYIKECKKKSTVSESKKCFIM